MNINNVFQLKMYNIMVYDKKKKTVIYLCDTIMVNDYSYLINENNTLNYIFCGLCNQHFCLILV